MVGQINARKMEYRRFNMILNRILCDLTSAVTHGVRRHPRAGGAASTPRLTASTFSTTPGVQVTETICGAGHDRALGGAMFRPAAKGTDHSLKEYFYVLIDVELQKYTTDPYVSLAGGQLCRTISTCFRDAVHNRTFVLCVDVRA